MSNQERKTHDAIVIDELLTELNELRELDRRRNAHAPGSAAHDAATLEVDLRSRRLMDRFRDLKKRRTRPASAGFRQDAAFTRPVDVRDRLIRNRGSLLN